LGQLGQLVKRKKQLAIYIKYPLLVFGFLGNFHQPTPLPKKIIVGVKILLPRFVPRSAKILWHGRRKYVATWTHIFSGRHIILLPYVHNPMVLLKHPHSYTFVYAYGGYRELFLCREV